MPGSPAQAPQIGVPSKGVAPDIPALSISHALQPQPGPRRPRVASAVKLHTGGGCPTTKGRHADKAHGDM